MSINANDLLNLQNNIGASNLPVLSSIDTLASLKAIDYFNKRTSPDDVIGQIARSELAFLTQGMEAVSTNPFLSQKFGSGLEGAMAIANLIKLRSSENMYNKVIDTYANKVPNREAELLADKKQTVNWGSGGNNLELKKYT